MEELGFEKFYEYCREHYFPLYRVSLSFNRRNVERLYEVYRVGVEECVGLVAAVVRVYGYRYRRMENFARECFVWVDGWVTVKTIITFSCSTGEGGNAVSFVFNLVGFLPFFGWVDYDRAYEVFSTVVEVYAPYYYPIVGVCPVIMGVEVLPEWRYVGLDQKVGEWRWEFVFAKAFKPTFHLHGGVRIVNFWLVGVEWVGGVLRYGYFE